MGYETYPVTGIAAGKGPDGSVPVRREFVEWSESTDQNDTEQFILFLLALDRFQKVDPSDKKSFFQVAGIHGFPYAAWDEEQLTETEVRGAGNSYRGYCMHANNLFPVWHRPYLLLYEQRIYETMVEKIIPEQPENTRSKWTKLASTWRLPYWDWAKNPFPKRMTNKEFTLTMNGKSIKLRNPLYQFVMPGNEPMSKYGVGNIFNPDINEWLRYGDCYATSRGINGQEDEEKKKAFDPKTWAAGSVNDNHVNDMVRSHSSITGADYGTAAELVYRLMTYPMDYPHFATLARDITPESVTASTGKITNDINLEFIHNNVHYWVGGDGGHMSQIPVACFDPVFWFHHCNLDRLFAMWQTLNQNVQRDTTSVDPNTKNWFSVDQQRYFDQKIVGGGSVVTNQMPLRPFHKDKTGTVWMPNDTINWYNLGYTYPELQPWKNKDGDHDKFKTQILAGINKEYGIVRQEALKDAASDSTQMFGKTKDDGAVELNDYAVSISFKKFAFGGNPFNLEVFLRPGDAPPDRKSFATEEFVTNVFNFSQPAERDGETVCSNCAERQADDVAIQAYIPLTSYLIQMIKDQKLASLDEVTVKKFLEGLYYRVTVNGVPIDDDKWNGKPEFGLDVKVSKMEMTVSPDPEVPPARTDPTVIPELGISTAGPTPEPAVPTSLISFRKIADLATKVGDGGSITVRILQPDTATPRRETTDTLTLLSLVPDKNTAELTDLDNYHFALEMFIGARAKNLRFSSQAAKVASNSHSAAPLVPSQWIQKAGTIVRFDLKPDSFDVWVDGVKLGNVPRDAAVRGQPITHIRYSCKPGQKPVLGNDLEVMMYQSTSSVK